MHFILQPWHLLFAAFCGCVHRRQQHIIEFQNSQIEVLLQKLGKERILLTDDQRRMLAVKGQTLGRKALRELTTIVTPDRSSAGIANLWHRSGTTARSVSQSADRASAR